MGSKRKRKGGKKRKSELRYDSASYSRRTAGWLTSTADAATEVAQGLPRTRDRSRDLVRNYGYATNAVGVISCGIAKTGIRPEFISPSATLNDMLATMWRTWGETSVQCDANGQTNIYGLQQLIARAVPESGDVLVKRQRRRVNSGLDIPLQIQVLEGDYLDTTQDTYTVNDSGILTYQGIQFGSMGQRLGYHVYTQHPGGMTLANNMESTYIPASEIAHVYRVDRPGQVRGMPWSAPIIINSRDLSDMLDALRFRQKISNSMVGFISDPDPSAKYESDGIPEAFEPGRIWLLPPGKKVEFANPPTASGTNEFVITNLRQQAAGWGISYESMTGDYSGVNYSSGRMGHLRMIDNFKAWQQFMVVPQLCARLARWFLEGAALMLQRDLSNVQVTWQLPRHEMLDPSKEIPPIIDSLRGGLTSPQKAIASMGGDYKAILRDWQDWIELTNNVGILFDSDPRKQDSAGSLDTMANAAETIEGEGNETED